MLIRNGCKLLEYPWSEQRDKHDGSVFMAFLVDAEGRVKEGRVDKSSGYRKRMKPHWREYPYADSNQPWWMG
jgi:hypothetical protein